MGIELVHNEDPPGIRGSFNRLRHMVGKVRLGASGEQRGGDDSPECHMPVGDETTGPMANVLKCLKFHFSRLHRVVGSGPFPSRDTGHLVGTDEMNPLLVQVGGLVIELTDRFDLRGERLRVFRLRIEPIATAMGLKLGLLLRTARHCERKSSSQCPGVSHHASAVTADFRPALPLILRW